MEILKYTARYKLVKTGTEGEIITGDALRDLLTDYVIPEIPIVEPLVLPPKPEILLTPMTYENRLDWRAAERSWTAQRGIVYVEYKAQLTAQTAAVNDLAIQLASDFEMAREAVTGKLPNGRNIYEYVIPPPEDCKKSFKSAALRFKYPYRPADPIDFICYGRL